MLCVRWMLVLYCFFFFQAEDGIRDIGVTGVQTCALPILPNPDVQGREKILRVHMRKVPLASDVEPKTIARGTPGFSGADLANLVNEAALLAARTGRRTVGMHEFEQAKDKVLMGTERRSLVMSEDEKRMTAYHEAGHALASMHLRSEEHTSELQSRQYLVCRLLLEKKKN